MLGLDGATVAMTGCIVLAIRGRSAVAWNIGEANRRVVMAIGFVMQAVRVLVLALAPGPGRLHCLAVCCSDWGLATCRCCRH